MDCLIFFRITTADSEISIRRPFRRPEPAGRSESPKEIDVRAGNNDSDMVGLVPERVASA